MKIKLSPFLQARFNVFLYLTFGWRVAKFYVFILGKLYYFFNRKEEREIKNAVFDVISNLANMARTDDVAKNVFKGIFSHYYEKLYIAFAEKEN